MFWAVCVCVCVQSELQELKEQVTMYESMSQFGLLHPGLPGGSTLSSSRPGCFSPSVDPNDSYAQLGIKNPQLTRWARNCIVLHLSISIAHLTAWAFQKRSWPQQLTLCLSLHDEALQATVSEGPAQGPYMASRVGFEPATLWSKSIDSTNVPPCPTNGTRSEGVWLHFGVAGPNRCLLGLGLMFFLDWAVQLPFIHSFIMAISIAPL